MAPHVLLSMMDMDGDDRAKLTDIFQTRPGEDAVKWANRVSSQIAELPSHLKKPNLLTGLLGTSCPSAPLCKFHKNLNPRLVRSIFDTVAIEIGLRCNTFIANGPRVPHKYLNAIAALRKTHSMWLDHQTFGSFFHEQPAREWPYQQDQCEACMLSRLGGNLDVLTILRTVLISRTRIISASRRRKGPPLLLSFVEQWIISHGSLGRERILQSDQDGAELKIVRKGILKHKRDERRAVRESRFSEGSTLCASTTDEDLEASDQENEIADHKSALVSTTYLPPSKQNIDHNNQGNAALPQLTSDFDNMALSYETNAEMKNGNRSVSRSSPTRAHNSSQNQWGLQFQTEQPPLEHKDGSTSRSSSAMSYVSPRSQWDRRRNQPPLQHRERPILRNPVTEPIILSRTHRNHQPDHISISQPSPNHLQPNQMRYQPAGQRRSQMYATPDASSSYMTVTSVHPEESDVQTEDSAYDRPQQIWQGIQEEMRYPLDTTFRNDGDRDPSRSSTISVHCPAPLHPRRPNIPVQVNGGAELHAQSYLHELSHQPSFAPSELRYGSTIGDVRQAANDFRTTLDRTFPAVAHNPSVVSISTTGRISPENIMSRRQRTESTDAAPSNVEEEPSNGNTSWSFGKWGWPKATEC